MAVSEKQRKENMKMMSIYLALVTGVIAAYILGYGCSMMEIEGGSVFEGIGTALVRISSGKIFFPFTGKTILGVLLGCGFGVVVYFFINNDNERKYHYKDDEVGGTGGFMEQEDKKEYASKHISKDPDPIKVEDGQIIPYDPVNDKKMYSQNMIMSQSFSRPVDSRSLIGNNNVLIVGGAGTGKSRFFIKPNVLQMNASYVITDPSGELVGSVGKCLASHGYKIRVFNISDMTHSNCYNPLNYIRDEAGVSMLIECLIKNTTIGEGGGDNQFFVDAEKLLYSACIFYLKDYCYDDSKKNFSYIVDMINMSKVDENNPNAKSPLDELFENLPHDSLAWKNYSSFKQATGKTLKSIIISCIVRLRPFMTPQVANLTRVDELHLDKLGDEKTALFIITPQADRTYSFLASMLYSQMFETLYYVCEQRFAKTGDERLPIPVRCMMDEFANIGEVPEFPSKLATMRKYNISASVVLQDISQIEAMYQDNWKNLVGNCSSYVFLGTQQPDTLKFFSEMLGKMTIRTKSTGMSNGGKSGSNANYSNTAREVMTADELGRMPSNECIVYTQNMRPVHDKKYDYSKHPYYPQTSDADKKNAFKYKELSIYDTSRIALSEGAMVAASMAKRVASLRARKAEALKDSSRSSVAGAAETLDRISFGEKKDKAIVTAIIQSCITKVIENEENIVCCIERGLPLKYIETIYDGVYEYTKKKDGFILFSDTSSEKTDNLIYGIANIKGNVVLKEKIIHNPYMKNSKLDNQKYIEFVIEKVHFDDFKKTINEELEQ